MNIKNKKINKIRNFDFKLISLICAVLALSIMPFILIMLELGYKQNSTVQIWTVWNSLFFYYPQWISIVCITLIIISQLLLNLSTKTKSVIKLSTKWIQIIISLSIIEVVFSYLYFI